MLEFCGAKLLLIFIIVDTTSGFLFGCGGGCAPPVMSPCGSPCGGATSWAYAPPRIIGYERIPLYAKVPRQPIYNPPTVTMMPSPSPQYYQPPPPPPPPSAPIEPYQEIAMPNYVNDGDTIIIETDERGKVKRRREILAQPPPPLSPPTGYVQSMPTQQIPYQVQPSFIEQSEGQPQIEGPFEQGVEVTVRQQKTNQHKSCGQKGEEFQMNQAPQPQAQPQPIQSINNYEQIGYAPNARKLRLKLLHKN